MWPMMAYLSMGAVRADAVFVSGLRPARHSRVRRRSPACARIPARCWSSVLGCPPSRRQAHQALGGVSQHEL